MNILTSNEEKTIHTLFLKNLGKLELEGKSRELCTIIPHELIVEIIKTKYPRGIDIKDPQTLARLDDEIYNALEGLVMMCDRLYDLPLTRETARLFYLTNYW